MRIESSVTSLSWIPSEAIAGMATKMPFETGIAHYDAAPPDVIEDIDALQRERPLPLRQPAHGVGRGRGRAHRRPRPVRRRAHLLDPAALGSKQAAFEAIALPDLHPEPEVAGTEVTLLPDRRRPHRRARPAAGAPGALRAVLRPAGVDDARAHAAAPTARRRSRSTGASTFPRHWVYDRDSKLALKSGMIDFANWYRRAFGKHSPWGDQRLPGASPPRWRPPSSASCRVQLMQGGAKPKIKNVKAGARHHRAGRPRNDLFLVLDGVVRIEVDGERLAEYGPGSMHGERAVLEGGRRTSTIRAVTACKLAVASADAIDRDALHGAERRAPSGGPSAEPPVAPATVARLGRRAMDDVDAVVIGSGPNGLVAAALSGPGRLAGNRARAQRGGRRRRAQRRAHRAGLHPRHVLRLLRAAALLAGAAPSSASTPPCEWAHFAGARGRGGVPRPRCRCVTRDPKHTAAGPGPARPPTTGRRGWSSTGGGGGRPVFLAQMLGPVGAARAGLAFARRARREGLFDTTQLLVGPLEALCADRFTDPAARALLAAGASHADVPSTIPGSAPAALILALAAQQLRHARARGGCGTISPPRSARRSPTPAAWSAPRAEVTRVSWWRATAPSGSRPPTADAVRARSSRAGRHRAPGAVPRPGGGRRSSPTASWPGCSRFRYGTGVFKVDLALDGPAPWASPELADCRRGAPHRRPRRHGPGRPPGPAGHLPGRAHAHRGPADRGRPEPRPGRGPHPVDRDPRPPRAPPAGRGQVRKDPFLDVVMRPPRGPRPGTRLRASWAAAVRTPEDLEHENPNLVGGDLGAGSSALDQQLVFRPVPGWFRYRTPVKGLYLCSASTHPGGGVHGMAGHNCARPGPVGPAPTSAGREDAHTGWHPQGAGGAHP